MVACYRDANINTSAARRLYAQRHPNREPLPTPQTILHAVHWGRYQAPAFDGGRPRRHIRQEERIIEYFDRRPTASTADAARDLQVSQVYAWRVLREHGMHPFHFQRVQELGEHDFGPRRIFCQWLVPEPRRNILWTDESTFGRGGLYNAYNMHHWAMNIPHITRTDSYQHRFSVNVWAGVLNTVILGPVFLGRLNGARYVQLLQSELEDMLEDIPLVHLRDLYFQHDGAPADRKSTRLNSSHSSVSRMPSSA